MPAKKKAAKAATSAPKKAAITTPGAARSAAGGPVPPYGPAIWDAVARGDISEMKAVAAAARHALFQVQFKPVSGKPADDAKRALAELDAAIAKLEGRG